MREFIEIVERKPNPPVSEETKLVVAEAQRYAKEFQHNYIGTEHLLIGLADSPSLVDIFQQVRVDGNRIRTAIDFIVGRGDPIQLTSPDAKLTPRARNVVEFAVTEALFLGSSEIRPDHLLSGIVSDEESIACGVLEANGVIIVELKKQITQSRPLEEQTVIDDKRISNYYSTERLRRILSSSIQNNEERVDKPDQGEFRLKPVNLPDMALRQLTAELHDPQVKDPDRQTIARDVLNAINRNRRFRDLTSPKE